MLTLHINHLLIRVLNVLRQWVEHHYADFERDPALLKGLTVFLDTVKGKALRKWIDSIHRALHRQVWGLCKYTGYHTYNNYNKTGSKSYRC